MSNKRSRSTFEADHHAPFAVFGTPLPNEDDARDDGAYLPVWKQDVRDDKGRRRLHGAFTGGWSAGYFNTVGSKEGWTPSTFVSSRENRRKGDATSDTIQKRAEEYMDEEDLADAAEAQTLQTSGAFAGLGSSLQTDGRGHGLAGLFRSSGETKGLQLLRRMGWKDGQGIGPKIRRGARIDVGGRIANADAGNEKYLFAPDDADMIAFVRKTDKRGLGHRGAVKLEAFGRKNHALGRDGDNDDDDENDNDGADIAGKRRTTGALLFGSAGAKKKAERSAFGVGVLNDTGSDDEDPYEMGPKISYNRVIGGDKKKKSKTRIKPATGAANPCLPKAPIFISKTARVGNAFRRCHDGRLPLEGFVLATAVEDLASLLSKYAPPAVPDGWKSSKGPSPTPEPSTVHMSTADAAKVSMMDPRSRAMLLGEKTLPGKSVFDFISSTGRDKLVAATGNENLPPGLGELPNGYAPLSEDERMQTLWEEVPKLEQQTAAAALSRGRGGPYADNEAKSGRYRRYLMSQANPGQQQALPDKVPGTTDEEYLREMKEFYNCARIFKPMTGFMASRFTTSKTVLNPSASTTVTASGDVDKAAQRQEPIIKDAAEEAAKMGMFGHMTRSVQDFYPTRLLCKRFNVRAPTHHDSGTSSRPTAESATFEPAAPTPTPASAPPQQSIQVQPDRNDAVEAQSAAADVLRAIFGDSDSE